MNPMNAVTHLDASAAAEDVSSLLEEDGCVIVDNLISEADMDSFMADMQPWLKERDLGHDEFSGHKTRRVSALIPRSAIAREIAVQPTVIDVCNKLLLKNCEAYRLQVTHMVNINPGEVRQRVHRDDEIFPEAFHKGLPDMTKLVHCMWAVSDFTEENGATSLVPGSHKWDRSREPNEDEIIPAVMSKGSVAFYLNGTLQGGGANTSEDSARVGALFGYSLGWLTQEENMYLTCPPDVARDYSEELQKLIGYDLFHATAGWVDDAHPLMLLKDDADFKDLRVL